MYHMKKILALAVSLLLIACNNPSAKDEQDIRSAEGAYASTYKPKDSGDIFIQYTDDEPYSKFLKMAQDALNSKIATSVKRTTYNANSSTGDVDWKKNIDGSGSTLNVRQSPRNIG